MKKGLFLTILACMGSALMSHAQTTDISGMDNALYVKNDTTFRGEQIVLSLQMKNAIEVRGFQCDIYLPNGISFVLDGDKLPMVELSTERTTAKKTNYFNAIVQSDGCLRVLCNSTSGYSFLGNTGEVATITVNVGNSLKAGPYTVTVKNARISDPKAKDHIVGIDVESNVEVSSYDDGYSLSILPFKIESASSSDMSANVSLGMKTKKAVKSVRFDLNWTKSAVLGKSGEVYQAAYDEYVPASADNCVKVNDYGRADGAAVSFTADNEYGTSYSSIVKFTFKSPAGTADSITSINLSNIVFTDKDNNEYYAAPYSTSVYIGSSSKATVTEGNVKLSGEYTNTETAKLLTESIPADDPSITGVDLRGVTALPAKTEIVVDNPNALIATKTNLDLANDQNVIIGDTCENLVISGDGDFKAPFEFTAKEATYARKLEGEFGTICLPYAPSTDEHNYYELAESNTSKLCFKSVLTPKANTPYLYAKKGITDKIVSTEVKVSEGVTTAVVGKWKMVGTYETTVLTDNVYFLASDNYIYRNTGTLTVGPFRAYFVYESSAPQSVSVFIDSNPTALKVLENDEVTDTSNQSYNILGQPADENNSGFVIVEGKKYMNK